MLALAWTVFTLFLAVTIWRTGRQHSQPELGFSTTHNNREAFFARFIRRMSLTAIGLCLLSAVLVWSSAFWAIMALAAIPALAAFQIFSTKRAIESGSRKSLP